MNSTTKNQNDGAFQMREGHILGLRTSPQTLLAYGGFQWPRSGPVEAPDWQPTEDCGCGLHFLPWGAGDASLLHDPNSEETLWVIISTPEEGIINLGGKSKCRACEVVYCGDRHGAISLLMQHAPTGTRINYGTATAGDKGTATAGNYGTATAGNYGTATAGYEGTATAGNYGTATAGDEGTATAGNEGTATAGNYGTATAGDKGTATAGYEGTATAGNYGTATAGDYGTATAGDKGTATAGDKGTATAGDEGVISIQYYDSKTSRYKILIGYIGEKGLRPGVKYRVNADKKKFESVDPEG